MPETVLVPGTRDVRATLDSPDETVETDACVVACPPHPQYGGRRSDTRLRAVSDALRVAGIACLRFDYGPWDHGWGELADAHNAAEWAGERYGRVGLFGYSFGATVALQAAASASCPSETDDADDAEDTDNTDGGHDTNDTDDTDDADRATVAGDDLAAVSALAPQPDAVEALDDIACPTQILHGERDSTVEWEPVVEHARELGFDVEAVSADHHFVGQAGDVAERVVAFLGPHLSR